MHLRSGFIWWWGNIRLNTHNEDKICPEFTFKWYTRWITENNLVVGTYVHIETTATYLYIPIGTYNNIHNISNQNCKLKITIS